MSTAAYSTRILAGGTPTTLTNAPTTQVSGNTYRINNAAHRILDPETAVVVQDDGQTVTPSAIDRLRGTVTLAAPPSGDVTVSGKFIPVVAVAGAHEYQINVNGAPLDNTEFGGSGFRTRQTGLIDAQVTLSVFSQLEGQFSDILANRSRFLIDIRPGNGAESILGWFVLETDNFSGELSALETESLSFQLDQDVFQPISWQ